MGDAPSLLSLRRLLSLSGSFIDVEHRSFNLAEMLLVLGLMGAIHDYAIYGHPRTTVLSKSASWGNGFVPNLCLLLAKTV